MLEPFPVWDDVRTFDGKPWRGSIDVISGGFPCQDISAAGKGEGIDGARSGLWSEFARIIREIRPRFAFVENSPMLTSRGLGRVLGDLAEMGFDAEWCVLGADDAGAPHRRKRIWVLAADPDELGRGAESQRIGGGQNPAQPWDDGEKELMADAARIQQGREEQRAERERTREGGEQVSDAYEERRDGRTREAWTRWWRQSQDIAWWLSEPALGRVAHGMANRVDRLKALGNGQVPAVAALAWRILYDRIRD
jgi:DNA (cytosine-5)-methyltransferase 1